MPRRLTLFVICAAAFGLYAAIWPATPAIDGDSTQYLEVARDLADGRLDALHDRTPGYPILLALTGSTDQPTASLKYVQLLLHLTSVWLLCMLCHAAGAPARWLPIIAVVLVLPPFAEPAGTAMTETLAQATLVAGLWLLLTGLLRRKVALIALAALALAFLALTRPVYQLLPFALGGAIVVLARLTTGCGVSTRDGWRAAGILVIGSWTVLGAYSVFNQQRFGFPGVTYTTGFHLTTRTIAFVERLPEEHRVIREILLDERNRQMTRRGGLLIATQTIWHARDRLQAATGLSQPDLSREMLRLNLLLIRESPVEYLQEVARSAAGYWFPAATGLSGMGVHFTRWVWAALYLVVLGLWGTQLVGAAGLALTRLERPALLVTPPQLWAYLLAAAIVFYTMALSCVLDIGEPRQRRPTDVLLVLMVVIGLLIWQRTRAARENRP